VTLESVFGRVSAPVRASLEGCLEGRALSVEAAVDLFAVVGTDLHALTAVADTMRVRECGDVVTYVVNRNVNFPNVCIKTCKFCAFARGVRSEQGYLLPTDEIVRRVLEARAYGATEVCLQAGLAPDVTGATYLELLRAVKRAAPDVHVHAFSPEEV
jgi:FO synthase subunit 2